MLNFYADNWMILQNLLPSHVWCSTGRPWGCFLSLIILPYYRELRPSHCVRKYSIDFKWLFHASILTSFVPFLSLTSVVQQNQMQVGILLWFQNKDIVAISWRSWLSHSSCSAGVCFWPGRLLECSTGDDALITGFNLCCSCHVYTFGYFTHLYQLASLCDVTNMCKWWQRD
jgi:hypothetical protein